MSRASIVFIGLAAIACGKSTSSTPDAAPAPVTSTALTPDGGASKVVKTATSTVDPRDGSALRALSEQERAKAKAYADGLGRGRTATKEKKWPAAIAAFDDALAAKPHDARALAERGYARLLSGKASEAEDDLREASQLAKEPKLLAQIHFNLGLAAEKTDPENARAQFWTANQLAPSAAAKAKIGDKPVCPISVRHTVDASGFVAGAESTTYLALFQALAKDRTLPDDQNAKTEGDARDLIFGRDIPKIPPAIFELGRAGEGRAAYLVVKTPTGKLRAHLLGIDAGGRCPGELSFSIAKDRRDAKNEMELVHVRGRELVEGGYTIMCFPEGGDAHPCTDDPDTVPRQSGCAGGNVTERDIVFDAKGRSIVVERTLPLGQEDAGSAAITVTVEDDKLHVTGLDCKRSLGFDGK